MVDSAAGTGRERAFRLGLLALAAVTILTAAARVRAGGADVLADAAVSAYIAGLVVYGVWRDALDADGFRAALYAGLVAWGVADLWDGPTVIAVPLVLLGGVLLARLAYRRLRDRGRPVYER
jgi:hypothetical protein